MDGASSNGGSRPPRGGDAPGSRPPHQAPRPAPKAHEGAIPPGRRTPATGIKRPPAQSAGAAAAEPPPPPRPQNPPLDGTLASYLERVADRAATAFAVPAVAIALVGDDRRCFIGGAAPPAWLARDPGALIRSRACANVLEQREPIAVENAAALAAGGLVGSTLGVPAYMIAPLPPAGGERPAGVLCVFAAAPRTWSADDLRMLVDHASATAPALALRRRPGAVGQAALRTRREGLHDPLTGLPNRVLFMERLSQAVARNRREPAPFAVILLDLDHFRTINESLGHAAGDSLLVAVAQRLLDCSRAGDTVARLSGDEFALLIHRVTHAADAARVAERVQGGLRAPIDVDGHEVFTSASFGIALESNGAGEPEHLLRSADLALGSAKRTGRARFAVFDRVMHAEALARLQLETELREASERDAFVLHYQPIISLTTGRVVSIEALVRWDHAERGLVPPAAFIAAAEATGIIIPVGAWVMTEACRQLRAWHEAHPEWRSLSIAVNISVRQLVRPDFVDMVARAVTESGIPPAALALELTESVISERPDLILAALSTLRRAGIRIHLDDFGTGYSSLAVLDRLPLDGVKIDRTFVQMLGREARASQFVRAMVTLAQSLRLETVGEGVATDVELRELRALGCSLAQGHLFAAAGDAAMIERLLQTNPTW